MIRGKREKSDWRERYIYRWWEGCGDEGVL